MFHVLASAASPGATTNRGSIISPSCNMEGTYELFRGRAPCKASWPFSDDLMLLLWFYFDDKGDVIHELSPSRILEDGFSDFLGQALSVLFLS